MQVSMLCNLLSTNLEPDLENCRAFWCAACLAAAWEEEAATCRRDSSAWHGLLSDTRSTSQVGPTHNTGHNTQCLDDGPLLSTRTGIKQFLYISLTKMHLLYLYKCRTNTSKFFTDQTNQLCKIIYTNYTIRYDTIR